jgi:outer membrane protein, heavy metal efflux system
MAIAIAIFPLIGYATAFAQTNKGGGGLPGDSLTVRTALEYAEASSPTLRTVKENIRALEAERRMSYGLPNPVVGYAEEGINPDASPAVAERRWFVSQSFDFPLATYHRLDRYDREIEALRHDLEDARRTLKRDVKSVYAQLSYEIERTRLMRENVELLKSLDEAIQTRLELGAANELDALNVEIRRAEAENDLSVAERRLHVARYSLFELIGLDPDEQSYSIFFPDSLAYFDYWIPQDAILRRVKDQPAMNAARARLRAAGAESSEATYSLLPDIETAVFLQDFGAGFDNYGFEVGLELPLWFFANESGAIERADAKRGRRFSEKEATKLRLKREIEVAWHSYETSKRYIDRFQGEINDKSQRLLELMTRSFEVGEIDALRMLEAQRSYVAIQLRYYESLLDYHLRLIDLERFLEDDVVFIQ